MTLGGIVSPGGLGTPPIRQIRLTTSNGSRVVRPGVDSKRLWRIDPGRDAVDPNAFDSGAEQTARRDSCEPRQQSVSLDRRW